MPTWDAGLYYWRGREITIEAKPEQAIWMDGGTTATARLTAQVVPGAWQSRRAIVWERSHRRPKRNTRFESSGGSVRSGE